MKLVKIIALLGIIMILAACGRSQDTTFYVLNPIPPVNVAKKQYAQLQLGIEEINLPAWLDKPQLMIHTKNNEVSIEEYHQWAESADKNIKQVITTNLSTLLPGAIIKNAPLDVTFKPAWLLHITIDEVTIDNQGNSSLRANYLIYYQEKVLKKQAIYYHATTAKPNVEQLVRSINAHLNHLTTDIAKTLVSLSQHYTSARSSSTQI